MPFLSEGIEKLGFWRFMLCVYDCVDFAAFVVQRNGSAVQGEACWCIRCEFMFALVFVLWATNFFVWVIFAKFWDSLRSQIMWAEAMGKLEGMESADRERLWPQLVQGFKDLSQRLKVMYVNLNHKWWLSQVIFLEVCTEKIVVLDPTKIIVDLNNFHAIF